MNLKSIHFIIIFITCTALLFSCKKDKVITIGVITGPSTVCYGEQNIAYSIALNPEADYVLWTVPEQAQVVSGQGTKNIVVNFGRKRGKVCAQFFSNGKEASISSCIAVNFDVSNRWCKEIDFKGGVRSAAVAFSIGNKGYLGTGFNPLQKNDFWEYDPVLITWTQKANFKGPARSAAVGFSIGNKGYVGTGFDGSHIYHDFYEYDPLTNIWLTKADCGDTSRQYAFGFSIGNKGYIGSGNKVLGTAQLLTDFNEYDPVTNEWVRKANVVKRLGATGFSIGNKGYLGMGRNEGDICQKDFREFDPTDSTDGFDINHHPIGKWTLKHSLPGPARFVSMGFSIGDKGYVGTGINGNNYYNDFWEYDPIQDNWSPIDSIGGPRAYAAGFPIGNKGYIATGNNETNFLKSFWVFSK